MTASSKHAPLAALALAAAAALTGCGTTSVPTGSFKGEQQAVAKRISSFQRHASEASGKKLCEQDLARALVSQIGASGASCEHALRQQLKDVEDLTIKINSIALHGRSATAEVKSTWSGKLRPAVMRLVREGKTWKIAGL
jgi:hypothetical protein